MSDPSSRRSRALELFEEFLTRRAAGEKVDFDALCSANSDQAAELRSFKVALDAAERVAPAALDSEPLSERLKKEFGPQIDPTLTLEQEPEPDSAPSSKLFDKLRSEAPRGTRYKLLGEVARGGMGAIIKIWDDELRRTLAMKVVLGSGDASTGNTPVVDPRMLDRFLEEAQVTGQLDHPGIVPVHELGLGAGGRVYFTMRLVKGEDLSKIFQHVRTGHDGWSQLRALGVMLKVCEAMSYAHSKKVVHRDLKPGNVMVGKFGEVYVMDWGLARVLGRADKHDMRFKEQPPTSFSAVKTDRKEDRGDGPDSPLITMDGDIVGTPSYMPPEQAKGQLDKLGEHSDVYAVGAMLYGLVAGEMPYVPRDARVSARTILISVLNGPPRSLHEIAPATPAELTSIIEKAMAREIVDRYPTMQALGDDLRAYVEGRVVHAYETGAWAEARKWVKRNKPLAASLAAAVVILIGGVVTSTIFASRATERAAALETANTTILSKSREIQGKNTELASKNTALDKAKSDAEQAKGDALANAARAEQKANDVLSLSAQKDLDELVDRAQWLWPAQPEMIPKYEAWLAQAHELIDGRPADPTKELKKRPSLEEHRAKLAELRLKVLPLTAEQVKAERERHPKYAELVARQSELAWLSRMLGIEPWPDEAEVEAQLVTEKLPSDADSLNALAWKLIDPNKPLYGEEVRALRLARRAVAAAAESERASIRDTLAWTLYELSRFDDALAEEHTAVAESSADTLKDSAERLEAAILSWRGEKLSNHRERREALLAQVSTLEHEVSERRTFEYIDPENSWWDGQLSKLVAPSRLCAIPS